MSISKRVTIETQTILQIFLQTVDVTYSTSAYCVRPKTVLKQFVDQYVVIEYVRSTIYKIICVRNITYKKTNTWRVGQGILKPLFLFHSHSNSSLFHLLSFFLLLIF